MSFMRRVVRGSQISSNPYEYLKNRKYRHFINCITELIQRIERRIK